MPTQRERVARMLKDAGAEGCTTADFLEQNIPRFGARIMELRDEGWVIETERVREGRWSYVAKSWPGKSGVIARALAEQERTAPPAPERNAVGERVLARCLECDAEATPRRPYLMHDPECPEHPDNLREE